MVHSIAVDALVEEAKRALGIERLVLAVHDACFPSEPDEDTGRGSPYTRGAHAFLAFVRELGFDALQLGPQGETSAANASPYDGSVFSKSTLSLPLARVAERGLLPRAFVDEAVRNAPQPYADHVYAHRVHHAAIAVAASLAPRAEVEAFAKANAWLDHDAAFEVQVRAHGHDGWPAWTTGDAPDDPKVRFEWATAQWILHEEHARFRRHLQSLGMLAYGDLQVGLSLRDRWRRDALFIPDWRMGAPPSRTNPEGQPWGYPVLDPTKPDAIAFFGARISKMLGELDGLRIDHPHGLVCPWVYQPGPDDLAAVRAGGRLHESPDDPRLVRFARVRSDQIDSAVRPWDDDHVRHVEPAQVDSYSVFVDQLMKGRPRDVLCEVLSTCPAPLEAVMTRHGLGRFRVTQKASLVDPGDGYRSEHARPEDWIMIGNHDTEPLLRVVDRWRTEGVASARAAYLSKVLATDVTDGSLSLARAMTAELFASDAKHVSIFFADLFGERTIYNRPGLVSPENWRLRVPRDFRETYEERLAAGEAMDLRRALATALRKKRPDRADLAKRLEESRPPTP